LNREKRDSETDSEELIHLKKTIRKLINKSRLYEAAKISIKKEESDFKEKKSSPTSKDYLKERNGVISEAYYPLYRYLYWPWIMQG
jgi:hypothetical protein